MTFRGMQPLLNQPEAAGATPAATPAAATPATPAATPTPAAPAAPAAPAVTSAVTPVTPAAAEPQKPGPEGATPQPPAKYELTLPEGGRVDQSDLTQIEELARKAGWTNEEAQAAVNEHDALLKAQSERFLTATKADPEVGGDKLAESQRLAKLVIDRIRPEGHARRDSFLKFITRGGAANHVEVVAFLRDLGKLMAEDSIVPGRGAGSGGDRTAADVLYGGRSS